MAQAVLIMQADPLPTFFSIEVARGHGAAAGWTNEKAKALAFARAKDAQLFLETYLPFAAPNCTLLPTEIEA